MKRLGLFLAIATLTVGLFGGFLSPKHSFASVTTQDKENIVTKIKNALSSLQGLPQDSSYQKNAIALIPLSANNVFKKEEGNEKTTSTFLEYAILNKYAEDLNSYKEEVGRRSLSGTEQAIAQTVLKSDTDEIAKLQSIARNAWSVEEGRMSQEEADKSNQSATESAKNNQKVNQKALAEANSKCSSILDASIVDCLDAGFAWLIKNTFLKIAGWVLWLTANMFNYSIRIGILEFAKWAPTDLYPIWLVIRQVLSLLIVFVGLYLGFMYILGKEEKFERYIPWVVMFALFVNFSYPLARTAIDVSNIVSLKIYTSALGNGVLDKDAPEGSGAGDVITNKLGLFKLAESATKVDDGRGFLGNINSVPGALAAVFFVGYAAYIFFVVTGIMIMRTVSLIFITLASPLLLVDSVLPLLGDKAMQLRKIFIEQLAVGPIFMIMLAITLKTLDIFSNALSVSGVGSLGASAGGASTIATIFNLVIMIGMLHIMIKVTKQTSGVVGEFGTNMIGKVGGFAGGAAVGLATGGVGLIGRQAIGRAAAGLKERKWVQNQNTVAGRLVYGLSNSLANSSFDMRNSAIAGTAAKKLGISSGMGTGAKYGFEEANKLRAEKIAKIGERIKVRHERDVMNDDGTIKYRKGSVDEEGTKLKDEYYSSHGGAMFLTKEQKEKISGSVLDEKTTAYINDYKKLNSKEKRAAFTDKLKQDLEEAKKTDKNLEGVRGKSLQRALFDIDKEEKEYQKKIIDDVETAGKEIQQMTVDKRQNFYARLSKDVQDGLKASTDEKMQAALKDANAYPAEKKASVTGPVVKQIQGDASELDKAGLVPTATPMAATTPAPKPVQDVTRPAPQPAQVLQTQTELKTQNFAEKRKAAAERARAEMDNKPPIDPPAAPPQQQAA